MITNANLHNCSHECLLSPIKEVADSAAVAEDSLIAENMRYRSPPLAEAPAAVAALPSPPTSACPPLPSAAAAHSCCCRYDRNEILQHHTSFLLQDIEGFISHHRLESLQTKLCALLRNGYGGCGSSGLLSPVSSSSSAYIRSPPPPQQPQRCTHRLSQANCTDSENEVETNKNGGQTPQKRRSNRAKSATELPGYYRKNKTYKDNVKSSTATTTSDYTTRTKRRATTSDVCLQTKSYNLSSNDKRKTTASFNLSMTTKSCSPAPSTRQQTKKATSKKNTYNKEKSALTSTLPPAPSPSVKTTTKKIKNSKTTSKRHFKSPAAKGKTAATTNPATTPTPTNTSCGATANNSTTDIPCLSDTSNPAGPHATADVNSIYEEIIIRLLARCFAFHQEEHHRMLLHNNEALMLQGNHQRSTSACQCPSLSMVQRLTQQLRWLQNAFALEKLKNDKLLHVLTSDEVAKTFCSASQEDSNGSLLQSYSSLGTSHTQANTDSKSHGQQCNDPGTYKESSAKSSAKSSTQRFGKCGCHVAAAAEAGLNSSAAATEHHIEHITRSECQCRSPGLCSTSSSSLLFSTTRDSAAEQRKEKDSSVDARNEESENCNTTTYDNKNNKQTSGIAAAAISRCKPLNQHSVEVNNINRYNTDRVHGDASSPEVCSTNSQDAATVKQQHCDRHRTRAHSHHNAQEHAADADAAAATADKDDDGNRETKDNNNNNNREDEEGELSPLVSPIPVATRLHPHKSYGPCRLDNGNQDDDSSHCLKKVKNDNDGNLLHAHYHSTASHLCASDRANAIGRCDSIDTSASWSSPTRCPSPTDTDGGNVPAATAHDDEHHHHRDEFCKCEVEDETMFRNAARANVTSDRPCPPHYNNQDSDGDSAEDSPREGEDKLELLSPLCATLPPPPLPSSPLSPLSEKEKNETQDDAENNGSTKMPPPKQQQQHRQSLFPVDEDEDFIFDVIITLDENNLNKKSHINNNNYYNKLDKNAKEQSEAWKTQRRPLGVKKGETHAGRESDKSLYSPHGIFIKSESENCFALGNVCLSTFEQKNASQPTNTANKEERQRASDGDNDGARLHTAGGATISTTTTTTVVTKSNKNKSTTGTSGQSNDSGCTSQMFLNNSLVSDHSCAEQKTNNADNGENENENRRDCLRSPLDAVNEEKLEDVLQRMKRLSKRISFVHSEEKLLKEQLEKLKRYYNKKFTLSASENNMNSSNYRFNNITNNNNNNPNTMHNNDGDGNHFRTYSGMYHSNNKTEVPSSLLYNNHRYYYDHHHQHHPRHTQQQQQQQQQRQLPLSQSNVPTTTTTSLLSNYTSIYTEQNNNLRNESTAINNNNNFYYYNYFYFDPIQNNRNDMVSFHSQNDRSFSFHSLPNIHNFNYNSNNNSSGSTYYDNNKSKAKRIAHSRRDLDEVMTEQNFRNTTNHNNNNKNNNKNNNIDSSGNSIDF